MTKPTITPASIANIRMVDVLKSPVNFSFAHPMPGAVKMHLTPRETVIACYFGALGMMLGAALSWTGYVSSGLRIG